MAAGATEHERRGQGGQQDHVAGTPTLDPPTRASGGGGNRRGGHGDGLVGRGSGGIAAHWSGSASLGGERAQYTNPLRPTGRRAGSRYEYACVARPAVPLSSRYGARVESRAHDRRL